MNPAPEPVPPVVPVALAGPALALPHEGKAMLTTNAAILDKFYSSLLHAQKLSPMTVESYRWKLGSFVRWMTEAVPLAEWTYGHFEDFLSEVRWPSPLSAHKLVCQSRKFIRWCKQRGIVGKDFDFTGDYKAPRVPRGKPKAISRDDLILLLNGAKTYGPGGRMEVAVGLCALAGLRRAECASVVWSDIDWEKNKIRISSAKTKKVRNVPMSPTLRAILLPHKPDDEQGQGALVLNFPHFGGLAKNGNRALRGLCRKVGIDGIGYHALRHTAATLMVRGGADLASVRDFLGHADLTMTSIYAWSDDESLKSAAALIL